MKTKLINTIFLLFIVLTAKAQYPGAEYNMEEFAPLRPLTISYNYSYNAPLGITIGYIPKRFGGYVSGKFELGNTKDEDSNALPSYTVDDEIDTSEYEKGGRNRQSYTAGLMIGLSKRIVLYGGAGYGTYAQSWDKINDEDELVPSLVTDKYAGPEFELGLMYRGEVFVFGLGCIYLHGMETVNKAQMFDVSAQIGLRF